MAYTFTRTGARIEEIHNTVEDPKSNAQFSDEIRTIAGEYRGLWPDTGGSANKGDTFKTQSAGLGTEQFFTALKNTTSDPVGDDVNWREIVSMPYVDEKNQSQDLLISSNINSIALTNSRLDSAESDISALQAGQGSGVIGYATKSELFADLNHNEGDIGYVTNDPTATNNGTYRKVGASGVGSWEQSSLDLASQAYQLATENESALDDLSNVEGAEVEEAFEIAADDGSVITRFDSQGQRTKGNNTSDFVGVRTGDGEVSGGMGGDSYNKNNFTIEANDESVLASFGGDDFNIELLNLKDLSLSKNKRSIFTEGLFSASVNSSSMGPEVNHVIQLGRSLAEGRGNIVFNSPSFKNVSRDMASISDSVVGIGMPQAAGNSDNEQYQFSTAEYFFELLKRHKNIDGNDISSHFHLDNIAVGGTTIEQLITLTIPRIMERVNSAKAYYDSMGVKYNFLCFMFTHSESNDQTISSYYTGVKSYIQQCRQIVQDATGQNADTVNWFTQPWDNGSDTGDGDWRLYTGEDDRVHYRISEEDEYAHLTGKTAVCERKTAELAPPAVDGLHLSGLGTVQAGCQFALGLYDAFINNSNVKTLQPERVYSYGNSVFVEYPSHVNLEKRDVTGNGSSFILVRTVDFGFVVSNKDPESQYDPLANYERRGVQTQVSKNVFKIEISEGIGDDDYLYVSGSDLINRLNSEIYDVTYGGSNFEMYLPVHPSYTKITKVN